MTRKRQAGATVTFYIVMGAPLLCLAMLLAGMAYAIWLHETQINPCASAQSVVCCTAGLR